MEIAVFYYGSCNYHSYKLKTDLSVGSNHFNCSLRISIVKLNTVESRYFVHQSMVRSNVIICRLCPVRNHRDNLLLVGDKFWTFSSSNSFKTTIPDVLKWRKFINMTKRKTLMDKEKLLLTNNLSFFSLFPPS